MDEVVTSPTAKDIRGAGVQFDAENKYCEDALTELFRQYPNNTDGSHVYLKVVTLNALYSTQIPIYSNRIPSLADVADHIIKQEIDASLSQGSPDFVNQIASITVDGKDHRYNYSFATKYCSWQRPDTYPIFDSRVNEYLWHLRNLGGLDQFKRDLLWDYPEFRKIVAEFRDRHGLGEFTFKQIDKFLYREGGKLLTGKQEGPQSDGGAEPQSQIRM
jgi:hypothetical protein